MKPETIAPLLTCIEGFYLIGRYGWEVGHWDLKVIGKFLLYEVFDGFTLHFTIFLVDGLWGIIHLDRYISQWFIKFDPTLVAAILFGIL